MNIRRDPCNRSYVQVVGRFIEKQNARPPQDGPGNCNALALTSREQRTTFADAGHVADDVRGAELLDRTGEIKLYRPQLPDFLDRVHLRNLRLSSGSADVLLHRHDENIAVTVTRREGDVVVVVRY